MPPNSMAADFGRTVAESDLGQNGTPVHTGRRTNVVIIVLDDVGFAQLGSFGSDLVTPNFDRLAEEGLRYNRFHVTSLCSPTRAALLVGRNHHAVGMGFVPDVPMRFPGYSGRIPPSAATVAALLGDAGYSTMAIGKWHLTPRTERTASGPFDLWPLGQGFERFYGFLHADTNQWTPTLVSDNHFVDPPSRPEDGYHLTGDLVDNAIRMVVDQQNATPDRPFFLYLATGAQHAPHHVPKEWIDRYRGHFDEGWEVWRAQTFARQLASGVVPEGTTCTPRPTWVQAWDTLPTEERRLYARMHEVFAGFFSHTDYHIGRFLSMLDETGLADNTVVIALSDNGASAEGGSIGSINEGRFTLGLDNLADNLAHTEELGGFRLFNHYAWGWAWAGNTPFRLWKRYAWLGGTRVPLIIRWPAEIAGKNEIRPQFCHVVDLMPTVLDICNIPPASEFNGVAQQPLDGRSLRPTFEDATASSPRNMQYFEMLGSRGMYADGWKATTDRVVQGVAEEQRMVQGSHGLESDTWQLFDLENDFSEAHDLASQHGDKVRQLAELWWAEAGRNQVLPMGDWLDRASFDMASVMAPPTYPPPARKILRPGAGAIADEALPSLVFGGQVEVEVDVPDDGGEGILCALGNWTGGWALLVHAGRLSYVLNTVGNEFRIEAPGPLEAGHHRLLFKYTPGPGRPASVALLVDDLTVASALLPPGAMITNTQADSGGLRIGYDVGFPVCDDYQPPFSWTGLIHQVIIEVSPRPSGTVGDEAEEAVHRD